MGKISLVMGMVVLLVTLSVAVSSAGSNFVLVRDDQTGHEYFAISVASAPTTPGHCDDTDHGFKPNVIGTISVFNPHTQGTRQVTDNIIGTTHKEYMCGDEGTVNGIHYSHHAFAFWYDPSWKPLQ